MMMYETSYHHGEGSSESGNPKESFEERYPYVQNYQNMFPKELPRLPPRRIFDLSIKLVPGAAPVSKTLYRMTTVKLKKLKTQL